jgi:hypothetical protein
MSELISDSPRSGVDFKAEIRTDHRFSPAMVEKMSQRVRHSPSDHDALHYPITQTPDKAWSLMRSQVYKADWPLLSNVRGRWFEQEPNSTEAHLPVSGRRDIHG